MTKKLDLECTTHEIKPQDLVSVILVYKKNRERELLITTTTSRIPLRVPATQQNIQTISLYCPIYEFSEESNEDYVEIEESVKNENIRKENKKKLDLG